MIKNIIFDWAGTIVDDTYVNHTIVMRIFRKLNIKEISIKRFKEEFILPIEDFYKKFLDKPDMEYIHKTYLEELRTAGCPIIYKETRETLKQIKEKNINTFVLSAVPQEILNKQAKDNFLENTFNKLIGSAFNKTQIIKDIIKQNNLNPEETAWAGSQTSSMQLAKENNLTAIAILGGHKSKEDLKKENPDHILKSIEELTSLI